MTVCLWPSAYTEHSVKNSPWKKGKGDVVREVSDACKKYGMDFGVYLSPWDRNSDLYGTEAYNDFFVKQLTELLTQYGKVSEVWFDGACGEGPNGKKQVYDFVRWYELIRKLQPEAVIAVMGPDVRWVGTETGRGREMEWSVVPKDNLDQDAIAKNSQKEVLTAPVGDMMGQDLGLLNLPPNKEGKLSEADIRSLRGFRQLYVNTFTDNLLAKAKVTCALSEDKGRNVIDDNYDTSVRPKMKDGKAVFSFKLNKPVSSLSRLLRRCALLSVRFVPYLLSLRLVCTD